MKRNSQHKGVMQRGSMFIFIVGILLSVSCNKDFATKLKDDYPNDTLGLGDGSKKVLYIILDGVRGSVLQELEPVNLTEINQRAIFSYDGLADYQRNALTQATAWTTMLTGVDYTKHGVQTEDFAGYDAVEYPSLFRRLGQELEHARTVALTSSADLNNHLAKDATVANVYTNDAEVKTAALQELEKENPALILAQFNGAELAAAGDYTKSNTAYADAIRSLDNYIGEMLAALRSRKTFATENWLVVIASSRGGGASGTGLGEDIYNDPSRNTFVAFYNPRFRPEVIAKPSLDAMPYTGFAPRFVSNANTSALGTLTNADIGNFGSTGDYTFMFKIRGNMTPSSFIAFLGKRSVESAFNLGGGAWSFSNGSAGGVQFNWNAAGRTGWPSFSVSDLKWHTMGFTLSFVGTQRKIKYYLDGNELPIDQNANGNITTTFPLLIGTNKGVNANYMYRDLVMLNVALSKEAMKIHMRKEFSGSNPYFGNVIGWWPAKESSGNRLVDHSGHGNDFVLNQYVDFVSFSDLSPNISPDITETAFQVVPNGVDIPVFIYHWMNVGVSKDWGLIGKLYRPTFNLPKD